MRVAVLPFVLITRSLRLDADFYIGNAEERRVERARNAIVAAKQRLKNAEAALALRNVKRRELGIGSLGGES